MEVGGGFAHTTRRGVYRWGFEPAPRYTEFHGDPGALTLAAGITVSLSSRAALDAGARWSQTLGAHRVVDGPGLETFGHADAS
jgi:hypothetical protein